MALLTHATLNSVSGFTTASPILATKSYGIARKQSLPLPQFSAIVLSFINPATRSVGRVIPVQGTFQMFTSGTSTKTGPSFYWK